MLVSATAAVVLLLLSLRVCNKQLDSFEEIIATMGRVEYKHVCTIVSKQLAAQQHDHFVP